MKYLPKKVLVCLLAFAASAAIASPTFAWVPLDPPGSCTQGGFKPVPKIKLRWASNGLGFTATEKAVIRDVIAELNQLPNTRMYIYEAAATDTCIGEQWQPPFNGPEQPANTICLMKTSSCPETACGQGWPGTTLSDCTHDFCEVELAGSQLSNKAMLYRIAQHEFSHCLGLAHSPNEFDWMSPTVGGSGPLPAFEHVGITRDTYNGLSYLNPFGKSFYVGSFGGGPDADILTRDAMLSGDTVPWSLTIQASGNDSWTDGGEVIADFGNEETLPYLVGDFSGDGCDDVAAGLCIGCDPSDGAPDTIRWYVKTGNCDSTFNATSIWANDIGNGEDYDQYRVGDFDGDGCDDFFLIRNLSAFNCDASITDINDTNACVVEIFFGLGRPNSGTCASGAQADRFVLNASSFKMTVTDRSAPTAWPWVVGDFVTTDGFGCADLAYGEPNPTNPSVLAWKVLKAADTNSDTICDTLQVTNGGSPWIADLGALGTYNAFAANAGNGGADDLIVVTVPTTAYYAHWTVTYSNGSSAFTSTHTPVSDWYITGTEARWTGKVFAVGNFDTNYGGGIDFLSLRGDASNGTVSYDVAYRNNGTGSWAYAAYDNGGQLPTTAASWSQPTDNDNSGVKDNAADDVKDPWWCRTCNKVYCDNCSGCCP